MAKGSGGGGRGGGKSSTMSFWGRGGNKGVSLTGNTLSGDTFKFKSWIKDKLGGQWDTSTKTWKISKEGVALLRAQGNNTRFGGS